MNKLFLTAQKFFYIILITLYYSPVMAASKSTATKAQTDLKPPLIITIHDSVQTITNDASCDKSKWKNNSTSACQCCLLNYQNMFGRTKTADEIVDLCTNNAKLCSEQSLSDLKSSKKIAKTSSSDALLTALSDDVIIRPVVFDTSQLTSKGEFTESTLPLFLSQALFNNPDFSKAECLKAKNIATQGGYNTSQLFLVSSICSGSTASIYIIKESKDGIGEATKLKEVANLPFIKDLIAPKVQPNLPSISLPIAYFAYADKEKVHYLSTMPSAKGKVLADIAMEWQQNQTDQKREHVARAFNILGKEIANFHKLSQKPVKGKIINDTTAHGDFHLHNLFFDPIGGHFTFIDNETIALYIKNKVNPSIDLCKPFFMPFNNTYQGFLMTIDGIDLKTWYNTTLKPFITGYVSTYPEKQRMDVIKELKSMFNTFQVPEWVQFYDKEEVMNDIINPIFNELLTPTTVQKK